MRSLPATVVSTTLEGPLDGLDATVVRGEAVDVVARLQEESDVPLLIESQALDGNAIDPPVADPRRGYSPSASNTPATPGSLPGTGPPAATLPNLA